MIEISHRGYWKVALEKNSRTAFERSFSMGFEAGTDLQTVMSVQ
jgi:glycerophosphoryl diester phosphodiesterase